MKLLSFSILLSSLMFTFNYVWINRIMVIEQPDAHTVLMNKWTGNYCVFDADRENRDYSLNTNCIYLGGEIELP
jgi:hypothetical protein